MHLSLVANEFHFPIFSNGLKPPTFQAKLHNFYRSSGKTFKPSVMTKVGYFLREKSPWHLQVLWFLEISRKKWWDKYLVIQVGNGRKLWKMMFVSFLWLVWQPVFVGFSAPEKYSRRPIGIGGLAKPHDFECEKPMAFWNSSLLKSDFQKRTVVWKKHQQKYECGCVFFCKFPLPSNIVSKFSQSFVDFGRCLGQWGMPSQTFGPFFTMWMTSAEERWMGKHGLL